MASTAWPIVDNPAIIRTKLCTRKGKFKKKYRTLLTSCIESLFYATLRYKMHDTYSISLVALPGRLAQLLYTRYRCGRSEVRFPGR